MILKVLEGCWMKFKPHKYQEFATNFIIENPISAIFLEMGLGKSVITLTAIYELMLERFEVDRVLVIAPLRVARNTWPEEIEKWSHLKGLTYAVAVGTEKERLEALYSDAHIYIINRENVEWLIARSGIAFNFDMVVIDELSSFKSHQSKLFKSWMKLRPNIKRIVGLPGTPSSNGIMDLWAEYLLRDMGERLGKFIGRFRESYFDPDKRNQHMIFSYKPKPGAEEAIYEKISDITISMKETDYLKLPDLDMNEKSVPLIQKEIEMLDVMKGDLMNKIKGEDR